MAFLWRYDRNGNFERRTSHDEWIRKSMYKANHNGFYFEPYNNGRELAVMGYDTHYDINSTSLTNVGVPPEELSSGENTKGKMSMLTIPPEADGLPVTAIGEHAFSNSDYDIIELPLSIKNIFSEAFVKSKVKYIYMPGVVTVSEGAFKECRELKIIEFPGSLTGVHARAFQDCCVFHMLHDSRAYKYRSRTGFRKKKPKHEPYIPRVEMPDPARRPSPEDYLIAEHKYRADDVMKYTLEMGWYDSEFMWKYPHCVLFCDKEAGAGLLRRQAELLKKYLGICLEVVRSESQELTYNLYVDPEHTAVPEYIHFRRLSSERNCIDSHCVEISSDNLPALVHACNEMITEYVGWCEEHGEDPYYALILPCGRTPYYYNIPSPCEESPLRDILLAERLIDEWNTIDEKQVRGEFNMYLREACERGDLIAVPRSGSQFMIPALAWGIISYDTEGNIYPMITNINNSRHMNEYGYFSHADSLYPSSLNVFCDMPPQVISKVLSAYIPIIETDTQKHRTEYSICGACKVDRKNLPEYIGHRYVYSLTAHDKMNQLRMGICPNGWFDSKLYFKDGCFPVAKVYLNNDGSWNVDEVAAYSRRQLAAEEEYCAERFGWNILK